MKPVPRRLLYLFCFLFFSYNYGNSQCDLPCNDNLSIEPAYDCNTAATSLVNANGPGYAYRLDSFCTGTLVVPGLSAPPPFCDLGSCVLNNPIWYSFIPTGPTLDIEVCPGPCVNGKGIQWALYNQCDNLAEPIACWCSDRLPGDSLFSINADVIPGSSYYLVIDGFSGASCDLKFKVNEGLFRFENPASDKSKLLASQFSCSSTFNNENLILQVKGIANDFYVNILDLSGRTLMKKIPFVTDELSIPMSMYPPGVYAYQIMDGLEQISIGKFIKQ